MSQRVLWAAIVLVFVALMANLYFQFRSAAVVNQAILRLTEQMGRSQQPLAEARIKVVDEKGGPRAGMKISVTGDNPSPYLSNATYSRTFVTDATGEIRTGRIPLGTYRTAAFVSQTDPNNMSIRISGAGFSLFDDGKGEEVTITAPNPSRAKVRLEPPQVAGWTIAKYFEFLSSERFGATMVEVTGSADFGAPAELPLLPSADVQISFRLEKRDERKNVRTFTAVQTFARNDPVLLAGGTIQLDLPRDRTSSLTADGEVISKPPAAPRSGD